MRTVSDQLCPSGVVVSLPDASLDDHVGAIEVLIQEGLTSFALPAACEAFADVVAIFGARAVVGATRVVDVDGVRLAAERGARFVLAAVASAAVAAAAQEAGLPCHGAAMTPTEVRAALDLPGGGVLLYPADVTGHAIAPRLKELGLIDRIVALGGVGAYAAGEWLKAGAQAVCVDSTLLGDAYSGGSLGQLRDRCSSFVAVNRRQSS
jgi:2-dehydro-3-deoxyphosphogluconate aldolase/(4S)-4-hydroxy-2-oxoglutarate aldolase